DLLRSNRIQLQRLLIDSQENKIVTRSGLTAFPAQRVLKTLLPPPRHGNKRQGREKITHKNHRRPKRADRGKGQTTVARQPGHWVILWNYTGTANPKRDVPLIPSGGASSASPIGHFCGGTPVACSSAADTAAATEEGSQSS